MKVWVNRRQVVITTLLLGLFGVFAADAEEEPGMELLEFLGEWQTDDGKWFDPLHLLDIERDEATGAEVTNNEVNSEIEEQADE